MVGVFDLVDIIAIPTISDVPVARPTTVYARSWSFRVIISGPASVTLTLLQILKNWHFREVAFGKKIGNKKAIF